MGTRRRSMRLEGYDYSRESAYFVTLCTSDRRCFLGSITEACPDLSGEGSVVNDCWVEIPKHSVSVEIDEFIVMPNHLHGVLFLGAKETAVGATHASPASRRRTLGTVIGAFKSASARRINELRGTPGAAVWQRNYYEHVIRSEESLERIREYIVTNPERWAEDPENPEKRGR